LTEDFRKGQALSESVGLRPAANARTKVRTFAGREVFSGTRMSRRKTNRISFRRWAAKLCEAILIDIPIIKPQQNSPSVPKDGGGIYFAIFFFETCTFVYTKPRFFAYL